MGTRSRLALTGAAALLLGLAACSGGDDGGGVSLGGGRDGDFEVDTPDGSAKVDVDGGDLNIETDDGSFSASSDGELPDGFPEDFPIPDGAKVTFSGSSADGDSEALSVVFSIDDSVEDVFEYFLNELPDAGYEIVSQMKSEGEGSAGGTIIFEGKADGVLYVGEDSGGTSVSLTLGG